MRALFKLIGWTLATLTIWAVLLWLVIGTELVVSDDEINPPELLIP